MCSRACRLNRNNTKTGGIAFGDIQNNMLFSRNNFQRAQQTSPSNSDNGGNENDTRGETDSIGEPGDMA